MKSRLIWGALPLLIYPIVAIASVMSLAGETTGKETVVLMLVARGFQISSLLYPVIYLGALVTALVVRKKNDAIAEKIASVPLWFLLLGALLLIAWMTLDG